jgi:hypothetical protein
MTDLRTLNDLHTEYNLKLGNNDVQAIQRDLSRLKVQHHQRQHPPQRCVIKEDENSSEAYIVVDDDDDDNEDKDTAISASVIMEHTTGQPKNTAIPPPRSQNHIKQRLLNKCDPLHGQSTHQRLPTPKNPMAEIFLQRIPALIEDPFAPMVTQEEMSQFREILAGGGPPPSNSIINDNAIQQQLPQQPQIRPPSVRFPIPIPGQSFIATPNNFAALADPNSAQFQLARKIQNSLSAEKRAELRAMFLTGPGIPGIPKDLIASFLGKSAAASAAEQSAEMTPTV